MVFTIWEIIQIFITIVAIGFIFSNIMRRPHVIDDLTLKVKPWWHELKFGIAAAAPAVILHELAHKFLALSYGFKATYFASWWGLSIGVAMKLFIPGFVFFIPGYVAISGVGTHLQFALVSLA